MLAVANTFYDTRLKNILYTVLAPFMGEAAIGGRLLLFETPEFTSGCSISSRGSSPTANSAPVFGQGRVMDVEMLGDSARRAIRAWAALRGAHPPLLPTTVPYASPPVAPAHRAPQPPPPCAPRRGPARRTDVFSWETWHRGAGSAPARRSHPDGRDDAGQGRVHGHRVDRARDRSVPGPVPRPGGPQQAYRTNEKGTG